MYLHEYVCSIRFSLFEAQRYVFRTYDSEEPGVMNDVIKNDVLKFKI